MLSASFELTLLCEGRNFWRFVLEKSRRDVRGVTQDTELVTEFPSGVEHWHSEFDHAVTMGICRRIYMVWNCWYPLPSNVIALPC